MSTGGTCTADSCTLKVSVKKWQLCEKHYQAFWKYGDPNARGQRPRGELCAVPGCERTRSSREGLCFMHRQRLKRTGSVERAKPRRCSKPDCDRNAVSKGLCQSHYDKARGSFRNGGRTCVAEGCSRIVKARGRCSMHYSKLQRAGLLPEAPLLSEEREALNRGECAESESDCACPSTRNAQCAVHHNRAHTNHNIMRSCRGCGADLAGLARGKRYCSDGCKLRCSGPECDRKVSGGGLCSTHAKQRNRGEPLRVIAMHDKRIANGPCMWCGEPVGEGSASRYCSVVCRNLSRRHVGNDTVGECAQCGATIDYLAPANGGGRRMTPVSKRLCDDCRHHSASLYMSAEEIQARDGNDCSICGLPVPKNTPRLHPLAAEVDHIVPIARGGTHNPKNLALAHKTCNIAKGDKGGWRRDPAEIQPLLDEWIANGAPAVRAECSADGCDQRAGTKGMCDKHYRRVKKYGTVELPERPSVCSEDDCIKPVRARGLCRSHYTRWLRSRSGCAADGCDAESHTRSLCKPHYNQWLLNRPNQPQCSEPGCTRISEVRRLCNLHYSRLRAAIRAGAEIVGPWD